MDCAFTIVASNYLILSKVLQESVKKYNYDLDFFIVVADKHNEISYDENVFFAEDLGISHFTELTFKYNLTEFCTAIKPFAFDFLFKKGYDKIIYFDPDILVFDELYSIYNKLNEFSIVLTPHFVTCEDYYSGIFPEGQVLFAGTFNLGFVAMRYSETGKKIVNWWKVRLLDGSYQDKLDGFHTDQKWMDFLPSFTSDLFILRHLGCNMAMWNFHERKLVKDNDKYLVKFRNLNVDTSYPLLFFHFSNYKFSEKKENFIPAILLNNFHDLFELSLNYLNLLDKSHFFSLKSKVVYKYNFFNNGNKIIIFQRRLYRRVREENFYPEDNPFEINSSFYNSLEFSNLLVKNKAENLDKLNDSNFDSFDNKWRKLNICFRFLKYLIGFKNYVLLIKFLHRYFRPENQTFLMNEIKNKIPFKNENKLKSF